MSWGSTLLSEDPSEYAQTGATAPTQAVGENPFSSPQVGGGVTLIGETVREVRPERGLRAPQTQEGSHRVEHAFSHRMRAIAHYAALGTRSGEIAAYLGISAGRVSTVLAMPECKQMVEDIQSRMFTKDPSVLFRNLAPSAARTLAEIMLDPEQKGSTRVSAADAILDRAYGKATQTVAHEAMGVAELFKLLDEEKKKRETIDVAGGTIEEAEIVEDKEEKWVKENL